MATVIRTTPAAAWPPTDPTAAGVGATLHGMSGLQRARRCGHRSRVQHPPCGRRPRRGNGHAEVLLAPRLLPPPSAVPRCSPRMSTCANAVPGVRNLQQRMWRIADCVLAGCTDRTASLTLALQRTCADLHHICTSRARNVRCAARVLCKECAIWRVGCSGWSVHAAGDFLRRTTYVRQVNNLYVTPSMSGGLPRYMNDDNSGGMYGRALLFFVHLDQDMVFVVEKKNETPPTYPLGATSAQQRRIAPGSPNVGSMRPTGATLHEACWPAQAVAGQIDSP